MKIKDKKVVARKQEKWRLTEEMQHLHRQSTQKEKEKNLTKQIYKVTI